NTRLEWPVKSLVFVVAISVVFLLSMTASPPAAESPIRIGGSYSNTGTYARLGQTVHRGHQLCVKHANDTGGVLGRKIEFSAEDDESDTAKSVAIYEKLLADAQVDARFA